MEALEIKPLTIDIVWVAGKVTSAQRPLDHRQRTRTPPGGSGGVRLTCQRRFFLSRPQRVLVINTDAKYARWPCLCFILIIHLLRHKELVSTVTRLVSSVRETCSNWKGQGRPWEGGGLFRIIAYNKSPALHFNNSSSLPPSLPPPPGAQALHQVIRTGSGWAQISSQSSFRWDEYKAGNTVKRFNKTNKQTHQ